MRVDGSQHTQIPQGVQGHGGDIRHMPDARLERLLERLEKRNPNDPRVAQLKAELALRRELDQGPMPHYAHQLRRMSDEQLAAEKARLDAHPDAKKHGDRVKLLEAELARRAAGPSAPVAEQQQATAIKSLGPRAKAARWHDGESTFEAA